MTSKRSHEGAIPSYPPPIYVPGSNKGKILSKPLLARSIFVVYIYCCILGTFFDNRILILRTFFVP